ncbi:MAG: hypothetical protein E6K53_17205 [Gammaproteobacteria bacterium]|nr:MAG: hypothetical protein E6K53_17205 [Gammaproteobacteria bacterium]
MLEAHDLAVRRQGVDSLPVAKTNYLKMGIMLKEKKFPEAIESARAAYAGFIKFEGESHPEPLLAQGGEIDALTRLGRMDEARALFAKADAVRREKLAKNEYIEEYYGELRQKLGN